MISERGAGVHLILTLGLQLTRKKRGGPGGGPTLGPMLKSLQRGPRCRTSLGLCTCPIVQGAHPPLIIAEPRPYSTLIPPSQRSGVRQGWVVGALPIPASTGPLLQC